MERSYFCSKYGATSHQRPPAGPAAAMAVRTNTPMRADAAGEQNTSVSNVSADQAEKQSRVASAKMERAGIAGQYRKPWIRPHTSGQSMSLKERRELMAQYRHERPKSSPSIRRQWSVGTDGDGNQSSRVPGNSRPHRRSSTPMCRRRHSVIESDVEEIVSELSINNSNAKSTVLETSESPQQTRNYGWTEQQKFANPETESSFKNDKPVPSVSGKPRLHMNVNNKTEDATNNGDPDLSSDNARSDHESWSVSVIEPPTESNNDNSGDDCTVDGNGDDRPRRSSINDVGIDGLSPNLNVNRRRSRSMIVESNRRPSSPSPMHDSFVRRAGKERRRRLSHFYQNTRLNRPEETIRQKLRRVFITVRVIAGICIAMKRYVKTGETKQWSLHEMHLNLRADMEKNLAFDLIMFSKLRVTRGSEKLKSILAQRPTERTKENTEVVLALLRKNKAFAEYRRETQIALIKVMEYQRFEARRIVLKEGHVASGFYILLSGTCLVNQKEIDPRNDQPFVRTITELSSGQAFGEYCLLNDCIRTASVVCKDEVEVLLINKDDFTAIIKTPAEQKRNELIHFCFTHDIYISAKEDTLRSQPKAFYTKFYRSGLLITEDIIQSEYIYVVKEGKCSVVAEIKEMKRQKTKGNIHERHLLGDESWKKDAALKRSRAVLGNVGGKRKSWSEAARNKLYPQEKEEKTFFSMNNMNVEDTTNEMFAARRRSVAMYFEEPPKYLLKDDKLLVTKKTEIKEERNPTAIALTWKRMTVAANSLSQKEERQNPIVYAPPSKIKTTYARLATLKSGTAFGIESLLPGTQPEAKLSLISDGAEVILVSKRLFASDVSSTTLKTASKMAVDYPSIEFTRGTLEEAREWTSYKNDVVKEIYHKKLDRRPILPRR